MKVEELSAIRLGAEMQSIKPYMDTEINGMLKSVVSFILAQVNNGTLTPEIALTKWVEYVSYVKLQQKMEQRIRMGQAIGAQNQQVLDIKPQTGYTS